LTLRLAWGRTGLPVRVVAAAETVNLFLSVCAKHRQSCLEMGLFVGLLALAGAERLVVDIERIGHQSLVEPIGLCQLRQQLGIFFRQISCAPLQPFFAPLLLAVVAARS
jgi:hypothetical protein